MARSVVYQENAPHWPFFTVCLRTFKPNTFNNVSKDFGPRCNSKPSSFHQGFSSRMVNTNTYYGRPFKPTGRYHIIYTFLQFTPLFIEINQFKNYFYFVAILLQIENLKHRKMLDPLAYGSSMTERQCFGCLHRDTKITGHHKKPYSLLMCHWNKNFNFKIKIKIKIFKIHLT